MIRSFRVFAFLIVLGAIPSFVLALEEALKTIPTRPKVTQSFVLIRPTGSPASSVVLFTGGNGVLNLSPERIATWQPTNFLVRNRIRFAEHGFLVAVVDAPSDRLEQGLAGFRTTPDHAEDIRQVIAVLRQIRDVPVWLAGTSMGTVSAANVAQRLKKKGADGLVLTSSVTRSSQRTSESLQFVRLEDILIPTLIVHHDHDRCAVTPYGEAKTLLDRIQRARQKEFRSFSGGSTPLGDPCEPFSPHGFYGIDDEVVRTISDWIKRVNGER